MGDISRAVSLVARSGEIGVNVAIAAYVAALGGDRQDVVLIWNHMRTWEPANTPAHAWDQLERAWAETRVGDRDDEEEDEE